MIIRRGPGGAFSSKVALSSFALLSAITFAACADDNPPEEDAGFADATVHPDATVQPDATSPDAAPDAGTPDTGAPDTGAPDTGTPDSGAGPRSIIFLHTNDEHSHELGFGPEVDDYPTPASPTNTSIVGGVKRRAKIIQQLRDEAALTNVPTVLASSGDMMMGSLFHIGNAAGASVPAIDYAIATALQYDVITLGNHEFDFGVGVITGALRTGGLTPAGQAGVMRIPVVTSNIRFSMTSPSDDALAALYAPEGGAGKPLRRFHIQTFGSGARAVKVGFFGLMGIDAALVAPFKSPVKFSLPSTTTACTDDAQCSSGLCLPPAADPTASSGFCAASTNESDPAVVMPQLVADAAATVAELRARGVDLVVAVTHVGVNEQELAMLEAMQLGPENAVASEEIVLVKGVDAALAQANVPGIDVVLGGHSHTRIEHPLSIPNPRSGIVTRVVQEGSYGRFVGKLRLDQAAPGAPWTLDDGYSGLVPVTAATTPTGLPAFTDIVLTTLIDGIMGGLEDTVISNPGDGLIYPGEQCDGALLPNNGNCDGIVPGAIGGALACLPNRQIDLSQCLMSGDTCNGSVRDFTEMCDGTDFGGATCQTLGYDGGTLGCNANCTYDLSGCTPFFPSLVEAALNFQLPGSPIRNDPSRPGDLFFYPIASTQFDVPEPQPNHESNLMNLVTDAERWALTTISPRGLQDPVRVVISANGVLRDPIMQGQTGVMTFEDLFRVLPLGVSPVENTPGFPLVDFWITARELRRGLEVGVNQGLLADSFWLGLSGARIEYDPSLPAFSRANEDTTGRITKIDLTAIGKVAPWDDQFFGSEPIYDRALGAGDAAFPDPNRLIHVGSDLYITLFLEGLGECPRTAAGDQYPQCKACTTNADCTAAAPRCDQTEGRCRGGTPVAFSVRSLAPINEYGYFQELKEFLALIHYIRTVSDGFLPDVYNQAVPRRVCCVGNACTPDRICAPQGT